MDNLERFERETFDLLVIGGGITGVGIAQDAAARGMQVALVEKADFASGTSSKSSKLVHGGLRYLQQLDVAVTREACRERNLLRRLAPGLVTSLPFLIPLPRWSFKSLLFSAGLTAYDHLAGVATASERHARVSREEIFRLSPRLRPDRVGSGLVYYDAVTDDARLTMAVSRSAARLGAVLLNYAPVRQLLRSGSRVCGAQVLDRITGRELEVKARATVNAAGVWIDQIRSLDQVDTPPLVAPAKGIHITISPDRLATRSAVLLPSAHDNRLLFVIPWFGVTVIGTTDTWYEGPLDRPCAEAGEVDYVLDAVNRTFSEALTRKDILSTFAGLRPLIRDGKRSATDVSRRHKIFEDESGLMTIAGGKLTTYRRMAADIVDRVAQRLSIMASCRTQDLPLILPDPLTNSGDWTMGPETTNRLRRIYGAEAEVILGLAAEQPSLAEHLLPPLDYIKAEVVYAVRYEMAQTIEDVLARRTRIILQDRRQGLAAVETVADLMARELGWGAEVREEQLRSYADYAAQHRVPD